MKTIFVLLILGYGGGTRPETVARFDFNSLIACEKAAKFYTRNPYPAMKLEAVCIEDSVAE